MELGYPQDKLDPNIPTGLILCGMGGPDGPDDVRPFLQNLFSDPRILPVPRLIAPLLAWSIARRRAPAVRERYAEIGHGGGSPQLATTLRQGQRLAELAKQRGLDWKSAAAMRYWHPYPTETVTRLRQQGAKQYLVVPTYPQFSRVTNGSTIDLVLEGLHDIHPDAAISVLPSWELLPGFIGALASAVVPTLQRWAQEDLDPSACALLFVAHSLPERVIAAGDPYLSQSRATVNAVHEKLHELLPELESWLNRMPGGSGPMLAFQSKVGPVKWQGPDVLDETRRLAASGCQHLHVQPVSFTCEHIETLHELDIELKSLAESIGITEFSRGAALNLNDEWLASLAEKLIMSFHSEEMSHVSG